MWKEKRKKTEVLHLLTPELDQLPTTSLDHIQNHALYVDALVPLYSAHHSKWICLQ